MTARAVTHIDAPGQVLYAFPNNQPLSDWLSDRVLLTEQASPNSGKYLASLDDDIDSDWSIFIGGAQPTDWDERVASFDLTAELVNDQLVTILAKTDLIGTGAAFVQFPVMADGSIEELIIGDDYKIANGRELKWRVPTPVAVATCFFGISQRGASIIIEGNPVPVGGQTDLIFEIGRDEWGALVQGKANFSVEMRDASGNEITPIHSFIGCEELMLLNKYT